MSYANIEDNRKYHREYMRERRAWLKSLHLCSECGQEDAFTMNGRALCADCAEKNNASCRKNYDAEKKRIYYKRRREQCVNDGICTRCKTRKSAEGRKSCPICAARYRAAWNKKQDIGGRIRRGERFKYGLCYKCGGKLDGQIKTDGSASRLCSSCYNASVSTLPKIKILYAPSSNSEAALQCWEKVLKKRDELLRTGAYDRIDIRTR